MGIQIIAYILIAAWIVYVCYILWYPEPNYGLIVLHDFDNFDDFDFDDSDDYIWIWENYEESINRKDKRDQ